jgi:hypothetical protein
MGENMAVASQRYTFLSPDVPDFELLSPSAFNMPGAGSSFGVLQFGDLEVELNGSDAELLPEHFAAGSAAPEDEITLSSGWPVIIGRIDGSSAHGHCFGIKVGSRCLLGSVPQKISLDSLISWLCDLTISSSDDGLTVRPNRAKWSPTRTPHVVFPVRLAAGSSALVDVRPAFRDVARAQAGLAVNGGFLSRQGGGSTSQQGRPNDHEYLVLNAPQHVVYLLSPSVEAFDEVAELGSSIAVRTLAN